MLVERFSLLLIINSCKDLLITIGIAAFSLHWREEHHILANKFKQNLTESNFASAVPRDTRKKIKIRARLFICSMEWIQPMNCCCWLESNLRAQDPTRKTNRRWLQSDSRKPRPTATETTSDETCEKSAPDCGQDFSHPSMRRNSTAVQDERRDEI